MAELSKKDKITLIENQEREVAASIYDHTIRKRVADNVGDAKLAEAATKDLVKLEKIKDELTNIRKEIE